MTDDVHEFQESLAFSHEQADQSWWEVVYRRAFPDMAAMVDLRDNGWHQRTGRDRAVILSSGRAVYIDEKVRKPKYDDRDVALEVWSKYPRRDPPYKRSERGAVPGWAVEPKDCEWLAYAFLKTSTCYLFPFLGVRAALQVNKMEWAGYADARAKGFRWCAADNPGYYSISIAVPIGVLQRAIAGAMSITWTSEAA